MDLTAVIFMASGCRAADDPITQTEQQSLKGSPIPEAAKQGMAKSMAENGKHPFVHSSSDYGKGGG